MEIKLIGEIEMKSIKRKCCSCGNNFLMTTNDFIFNNFGIILYRPNEGVDDWICKECANKVQQIKNL